MTPEQFNDLVLRLEDAEQAAHRLGMHATAHAINAAKNKAGWERAEQLGRRLKSRTANPTEPAHE